METIIAYCGLRCDTCPIYLATLETDGLLQNSMRESIAVQCSTYYGMKINADDVTDCYGCRTNSNRLFSGCFNCRIRRCAIDRKIENCAFCEDFGCEILQEHFTLDPSSRTRLLKIRNSPEQ